MIKNNILSLLLILPCFIFGKNPDTLLIDDFIGMVTEHHPVAFQIKNNNKIGDLQLKKAKGGFEPVVNSAFSNKAHEEKDYYTKFEASLTVPIWYGLSAETGFELNKGTYVNPENRTNANGLWYSGINLSLISNLVYNDRLANLDKAKIVKDLTVEEQRIIRNELLRDAALQYWDWYAEYEKLILYENIFKLTKKRLELTQALFGIGELSKMDTIEAQSQFLTRKISFENQKALFEQAQNKLDLYLWKDGVTPIESKNIIPFYKAIEFSIDNNEIDSLVQNHALLKISMFEFKMKEIELRMKKEKVKPKLDLNLYYLDNPGASQKGAWYENSYVGAKFSYPIFSIQARSDVKIKKLELDNKKLDITMKEQSIYVKLRNAFLNNTVLQMNLKDLDQAAQNTQDLLNYENDKFSIGESTLLKVNLRENYLLTTNLKPIEIISKLEKNRHYLAWYSLYF
jgi:outer membrane protein TolC